MGLLCAQVAELRKKLGEMGLDTKGLKAVLVKRLTDAVAKQEQEVTVFLGSGTVHDQAAEG